jgi:hypothetical protein
MSSPITTIVSRGENGMYKIITEKIDDAMPEWGEKWVAAWVIIGVVIFISGFIAGLIFWADNPIGFVIVSDSALLLCACIVIALWYPLKHKGCGVKISVIKTRMMFDREHIKCTVIVLTPDDAENVRKINAVIEDYTKTLDRIMEIDQKMEMEKKREAEERKKKSMECCNRYKEVMKMVKEDDEIKKITDGGSTE